MRILRLIFSAFLLFSVVTVVGFFFTREVLLYWGASKIKNSIRELSHAQSRGSFVDQCAELGAVAVSSQSFIDYQIRFITSSEYLVETVCDGFEFDPITISQSSLPQFVTKVPGTSGLIMGPEQNGIELEVFANEIAQLTKTTGFDLKFLGKKKALVVENGVLIKDNVQGLLGDGPVTVCEGYGYVCCNEVTHFGVGDKIIGLPDCAQSCFASCATRPVLLSFNTNPLLDSKTRSVSVTANSPVEFTFVANAGEGTSLSGVLDFGDGIKAMISGLAGQTAHTYECLQSICEYTASIVLEDNWGSKSVSLDLSKIKIIVTR